MKRIVRSALFAAVVVAMSLALFTGCTRRPANGGDAQYGLTAVKEAFEETTKYTGDSLSVSATISMRENGQKTEVEILTEKSGRGDSAIVHTRMNMAGVISESYTGKVAGKYYTLTETGILGMGTKSKRELTKAQFELQAKALDLSQIYEEMGAFNVDFDKAEVEDFEGITVQTKNNVTTVTIEIDEPDPAGGENVTGTMKIVIKDKKVAEITVSGNTEVGAVSMSIKYGYSVSLTMPSPDGYTGSSFDFDMSDIPGLN